MDKDALSGIRVLDFTWMLAGPYATRTLADFGAEVIKIQCEKTAGGAESNLRGYFNTWNRNKRSITLDMSHPEAREIALKLIGISDMVVENFSPRVMRNWGLGYEDVKEVKPDLIMVSLSAMGQTGPWKDFVGYGPTIQALSGLTYLTSYTQDDPVGLGYSHADVIAGLYAVLAVLASLEHRDKTGQGQYIDLSEYEAMCSVMGPTLLDASLNRDEILPKGNRPDHMQAAPYGCYRCLGEDRWCVIAVFNDEEWEALCNAMGHPSWTNETKFSTMLKRARYAEELDQLLEKWTVTQRPEDLVLLLQESGVPAGVVQDAQDISNDPQLAARNYFTRLEHPVLGKTTTDTSPVRFSDIITDGWKAAPLLGEDNGYVYRDLLGMSEKKLIAYREKWIIG
ncbi:MAG: CoA transferase [Thermodesulfobacteriota bacterium]|nr:CoA transferase [Thermodesulfobacteriota bacterium]